MSDAKHVGDTGFEGWLSCHEPDRNQNRTMRYSKQDLRDAYWAGYQEAAAPQVAQPQPQITGKGTDQVEFAQRLGWRPAPQVAQPAVRCAPERDPEDELNCAEEVLDALAIDLGMTETAFDCIGDYITAVVAAINAKAAKPLTDAAPKVAQPLVTAMNIGAHCLGEDECRESGLDFASYERGMCDAAEAFGRNAAPQVAQPQPAPEHVCGLQGFGALGDVCPACAQRRSEWDAEKAAPQVAQQVEQAITAGEFEPGQWTQSAMRAIQDNPGAVLSLLSKARKRAAPQVVQPLTADDMREPKNGSEWRVEWWNETARLMLPAGMKFDGFTSYKNGTIIFTIKRAHGIGKEGGAA